MEETKNIDWNAFSFYWSPKEGKQKVQLSNWRQRQDNFKGTPKVVLVFDVHGVDTETFFKPKEFKVSGLNALQFQSMIQQLDSKGEKNLFVEIDRDKKNRYVVTLLDYVYDRWTVRN